MDVRRLQRDGLLKDNTAYSWYWKDASGTVMAAIDVRALRGGVQFDYRLNDEHEVSECVQTTTTACNYGGERIWFVCPCCDRRCAIVYLSRQVACRTCQKFRYPSQSEDETDATWREQRILEEKLGGSGYWKKPKGMHQVTFNRMHSRIIALESKRVQLLGASYRHLFGDNKF
ncbi:hypothetical protein CR159_04240 [Pollutimonas subterranea]|uniref:Uncharacterized protein n=1 Tax=Pollutimonas subterranea TaxID=2045210 RepID=A0A2N4U8U8_9BURK|nr:hypothetical protein CR159_04240 [Pollutimonas subterranea]